VNANSGASCAETAQTWLATETHEDMTRCAAVTAQNSEGACESILTAWTGDDAAAKACTYEEIGDYSSKWDVTVTIVVVAEASMLDESFTTLSLGTSQSAPVALSAFDIDIVYHDIYRNIITAWRANPAFRATSQQHATQRHRATSQALPPVARAAASLRFPSSKTASLSSGSMHMQ
jgi:hypothetical protein